MTAMQRFLPTVMPPLRLEASEVMLTSLASAECQSHCGALT
jgi:hypothetical protein